VKLPKTFIAINLSENVPNPFSLPPSSSNVDEDSDLLGDSSETPVGPTALDNTHGNSVSNEAVLGPPAIDVQHEEGGKIITEHVSQVTNEALDMSKLEEEPVDDTHLHPYAVPPTDTQSAQPTQD